MRKYYTPAVFGLFFLMLQPALAYPPAEEWLDDFNTPTLDNRYDVSLGGTGGISPGTNPRGTMQIAASGTGEGSAKLTFGGEQWNPRRRLVFQGKVFLNVNNAVQSTIGLLGQHGENVLALTYDARTQTNPQWIFQVRSRARDGVHHNSIPTYFVHQPGSWFEFEIQTTGGPRPEAVVFIDGKIRGRTQWPEVPTSELMPVFQVWNHQLDYYTWSQPTMWIDWWRMRQER